MKAPGSNVIVVNILVLVDYAESTGMNVTNGIFGYWFSRSGSLDFKYDIFDIAKHYINNLNSEK